MTDLRPLVPLDRLRPALGPDAAAALDRMLDEVATDPGRIGRLFPGAARRTRRGPLDEVRAGEEQVLAEDAVRVALVVAAASGTDGTGLRDELAALYRFGDSDEKRAVLLALGGADPTEVDGSEILLDALRTNDTRLVAAAMGPHARVLAPEAWRHGVLKCLFTGVPIAAVADLHDRADDELGAMAERYAAERRAAGRDVPLDVETVLTACSRTPGPDPTEA